MAGSYPDVPSRRIAYHEDGTVMWRAQTLAGGSFGGSGYYTGMVVPPLELLSSQKIGLNNENSTSHLSAGGPGALDYGFAWIWPEKRDIFGFYGYALSNAGSYIRDLEYSTESRNMITKGSTSAVFGVFSTAPTQPTGNDDWSVDQSYREFVGAYSASGTNGVRARTATPKSVSHAVDMMQVAGFHWYGDISDGANPDRLLFMDDATGLEYDEVQDWGDKPRGSVHFKDIYVLNNSATLSASSNVFTFEGLSETSFEWYSLRDNSDVSTSFSTSITINGPIAAGARYPLSTSFTIRQVIADDEDLGPASAYLKLFTGTWA